VPDPGSWRTKSLLASGEHTIGCGYLVWAYWLIAPCWFCASLWPFPCCPTAICLTALET